MLALPHLLPSHPPLPYTPRLSLFLLPFSLSPLSLGSGSFRIPVTLFPTISPGTSVPIFLTLLDCILYPDGITLQAGRIYSTPPLSPHLAHQTQHLQEGHFLSVPAEAETWVGQRRSWQKQINTSSFQLGLEIRAPGEEAEALTGAAWAHPPWPLHTGFPSKTYLGPFR